MKETNKIKYFKWRLRILEAAIKDYEIRGKKNMEDLKQRVKKTTKELRSLL